MHSSFKTKAVTFSQSPSIPKSINEYSEPQAKHGKMVGEEMVVCFVLKWGEDAS